MYLVFKKEQDYCSFMCLFKMHHKKYDSIKLLIAEEIQNKLFLQLILTSVDVR